MLPRPVGERSQRTDIILCNAGFSQRDGCIPQLLECELDRRLQRLKFVIENFELYASTQALSAGAAE